MAPLSSICSAAHPVVLNQGTGVKASRCGTISSPGVESQLRQHRQAQHKAGWPGGHAGTAPGLDGLQLRAGGRGKIDAIRQAAAVPVPR